MNEKTISLLKALLAEETAEEKKKKEINKVNNDKTVKALSTLFGIDPSKIEIKYLDNMNKGDYCGDSLFDLLDLTEKKYKNEEHNYKKEIETEAEIMKGVQIILNDTFNNINEYLKLQKEKIFKMSSLYQLKDYQKEKISNYINDEFNKKVKEMGSR